jgi:putative ABC transport system substrate-binding protein
MSFLQLDLAPKRVDLLKEAVPAISRVAILSNPDHAGDASELRATRDAARQGGLAVEHFQVRTDDSFEPDAPQRRQLLGDGKTSMRRET